VLLRVLRPDHDVHCLAELGEPVDRQADRAEALRGDDPEAPSFSPQDGEQAEHVVECLELGVERLVVQAIGLHELVDPVGVEVAHLGDQARPTDRGAHQLLVRLTTEHGQRRMLHRGQDDRPGVDQRAVEVEQDDASHVADRSLGVRDPMVPRDPAPSARRTEPRSLTSRPGKAGLRPPRFVHGSRHGLRCVPQVTT